MLDAVLVDNDVILKTCCYGVGADLLASLQPLGHVGVLGSARFVVAGRIRRTGQVTDREAATAAFDALLPHLTPIEPEPTEIELAAEFEAEAQRRGLALDAGESQLLAILIRRGAPLLVTGDKRAIEAVETAHASGHAERAADRVACLEQVMLTLLSKLDPDALRAQVCLERALDKALAICFACSNEVFVVATAIACLRSYINDLRRSAPTVLIKTGDLSAVIP
jgi:hypothetical protein